MYEQTWQGRQTARPGGASGETGAVGMLLPAGVPGAVGHPLAVVSSEAVIGREDDCDVVLDSGRVSRRHARVWSREGRFGIEDLGSLNGTYVNRQRVVGSREIVDGDRLTLADVELQFRAVPPDTVARLPRRPSPFESRRSRGATQPMPPSYPVLTAAYTHLPEPPPTGLAQDLSLGPVLLMLIASLAGAVAGQAVGAGQWGALALAVATPLAVGSVALTTSGRPRIASVVVLTLVAALLTVTGVTAAELRLGQPITPWTSSGGTFISATQIDRLLGHSGLPAGCGASPTVTLSPARGSKTVPIQLTAHCFKAGEVVDVSLEGATLAGVRADDNGILSTALAISPDADCPRGECTLLARGAQSLREQVARYVVTSSR
jgi:FHA domain